jgi:hypothetical protein
MSAAFECDYGCGGYYKHGFKGSLNKIINKGDKQFDIRLKVSKSPHVCPKCWPKFCKLLYDELKGTYATKVDS